MGHDDEKVSGFVQQCEQNLSVKFGWSYRLRHQLQIRIFHQS